MTPPKAMKVLIADDDKTYLRTLARSMERLPGTELFLAQSLAQALQILKAELVDVAFVDIRLSSDGRDRDGLKLVQELRAKHNAVPVILGDRDQMAELREAVRRGARQYLLKAEVDDDQIAGVMGDLDRQMDLEREVIDLRARSLPDPSTLGLIGDSSAIRHLRAMIRKVALLPNTDA